jgi:hypothetical protein
MKITRRALMLVLLCTAGFSAAQGSDPFPLGEGNVWIYKVTGVGAPSAVTAQVIASEDFDGVRYYQYQWGTSDPVWLRSQDGRVYRYDPQTRQERLAYDFTVNVGETVGRFPENCDGTANLRAKGVNWKGEIGAFNNAIELSYNVNCADAGTTAERYVPGLGLVTRDAMTIAGPRTFELVYANIDGREVSNARGLGFSALLDKYTYSHGSSPAVLKVTMTLTNKADRNVTLAFPTSQEFEVIVRDATGRDVARWSRGLAFLQVEQRRLVTPGVRVWLAELPLVERSAVPGGPADVLLANGNYTAVIRLTSRELYSATVPFQIFPIQGNN